MGKYPTGPVGATASAWLRVPDILTGRWSLGTATLDGTGGNLIIGGGLGLPNGNTPLQTTEILIGAQLGEGAVWQLFYPMLVPRGYFGMAVGFDVNQQGTGKIYAVGGWDGSFAAPTGEVLGMNAAAGWASMGAFMATPRVGLGLASLYGKLYAVGGYFNSPLASVERYDQVTELWESVASMNTQRQWVGVAALGGYLYAVGGLDGSGKVLASMERYDPVLNTWSMSTSMSTARQQHGVAVYNGKLYAVGGVDGGGKVLASVEVFDPATSKWAALPSMGVPRRGPGVAISGGVDNAISLYVVGGSSSALGEVPLASAELYTLPTI